jgi:hypothetical protein
MPIANKGLRPQPKHVAPRRSVSDSAPFQSGLKSPGVAPLLPRGDAKSDGETPRPHSSPSETVFNFEF